MGETTARVEKAAQETFITRAQNPCLGGFPWLENDVQPIGTTAIYPENIGYVQHIDIGKMAALLAETPIHVYLIAEPGSFVHPSRPAMYATDLVTPSLSGQLLSTLSVSDDRSFNQDPRFCLCVMAEIACRALSPAVNDPGTAIDVIGRGVKVLSEYGRNKQHTGNVQFPMIHIAPLSPDSLFDDFFPPSPATAPQ